MSDDDYILPREVSPGMRVEILTRPWVGTVTEALRPDGTIRAICEDGVYDGIETSWAVDNIGSIRRLPAPMPTEPGARFWGRTNGSEPQWWFVRTNGDDERPIYCPAVGAVVFNPEPYGLRRLPVPDGAS